MSTIYKFACTVVAATALVLSVPAMASSTLAATSPADGLLPDTITRDGGTVTDRSNRAWTIRDTVEISEIRGIAVAQQSRQIAFIIRQPRLETGAISYGLYVVDVDGSKPARKLLEAAYIGELSRNPHEHAWSALADLGAGVQVYDIDDSGATSPLLVNEQTVATGTGEGVITSVYEPLHTGIISYEWSPDGTAFWYSRARVRSADDLQALTDKGILYDDRTMLPGMIRSHPGLLLGVELHVVTRSSHSDRIVGFAPSSASSNLSFMRRTYATAFWAQDSRHILYLTRHQSEDGKETPLQMSLDVQTGTSQEIDSKLPLPYSILAADGAHFLAVLNKPDGTSHLAEYDKDGALINEGANVPFIYVSSNAEYGAWRDKDGRSMIAAVHYGNRNGLIRLPESKASRIWSTYPDNISHCSFSRDLSLGACVRDSLTSAPAVVLVDTNTGSFKTLARPNIRYDAIEPLHSEYATWTNRFGEAADGYITYPRRFDAKLKYPAIVVSHGTGARNEFVARGFQAEVPIQVLAEDGYVVLSVNEVRSSLRARNSLQERGKAADQSLLARTQLAVISSPVATLEAALKDVIDRGFVEADKVGIAGYSRGAEVAVYAMTQSKKFRAASIGDGASGVNADGYWSWGTREGPSWYSAIYGGSAYDSDATIRENYRRFSPSFRADSYAGPLLEQTPVHNAPWGLERLTLLREAGIPFELHFYPNESHILWQPRHSAASMERTVDWFDYWLLDKIDSNPAKTAQYRRWKAMADVYRNRPRQDEIPQPSTSTGPTGSH